MAEIPRLRGELLVPKTQRDRVPVGRLTIQGSAAEVARHGPPQQGRGIVFVVDLTSAALNDIRQAIIEFVKTVRRDDLVVHVVPFSDRASLVTLPDNPRRAQDRIEEVLVASDAELNYTAAAEQMKQAAYRTMYPYPGKEVCVIICADGTTEKYATRQAQHLWTSFIRDEYVLYMGTNPYVAVIETGPKKVEVAMSGFICDRAAGNYSRANKARQLTRQFTTVCDASYNLVTVTAQYQFSKKVYLNINDEDAAYESVMFAPIDANFKHVFWLPRDELKEENGESLHVICNGIDFDVPLRVTAQNNECKTIEKEYKDQLKSDEAAGVALQKNQSFSIDSTIQHVQIEAAWIEAGDGTVDVDVSATVFRLDRGMSRHINFSEKTYPAAENPAVILHKDITKGGGEGEKMDIYLDRVPDDDGFIVLSVTIFSGTASFTHIASCIVKVTNEECEPGDDPHLCFFNLSGESEGRDCNAIIMAYFKKNPDSTWSFHAIGENATGRKVQQLEPELKELIAHAP